MKFEEILTGLNIPFVTEGHHHCRPGWLQMDCPFCSPGWQKWRLGYNLAYRYLNCWSCGRQNIAEVLSHLADIPFGKAKGLLGDLDREFQEREDKRGKLILPKGLQDELSKKHRRYLRERGYDPDDLVEKWEIKSIGLAAHLAWRIFVPIIHRGEVVSWTTRSNLPTGQRWRSASEEQEALNHKELLYGEDYTLGSHAIVVHEGPTDVWATGPGAVGVLGTSLKRAQILRMAKYMIRVICFDNEPSAQRRAKRLCDMLEVFEGRTINVQLTAKDSSSALLENPRELKRLRQFLR